MPTCHCGLTCTLMTQLLKETITGRFFLKTRLAVLRSSHVYNWSHWRKISGFHYICNLGRLLHVFARYFSARTICLFRAWNQSTCFPTSFWIMKSLMTSTRVPTSGKDHSNRGIEHISTWLNSSRRTRWSRTTWSHDGRITFSKFYSAFFFTLRVCDGEWPKLRTSNPTRHGWTT